MASGAGRALFTPPWRKAPLLLLRFPSVFAAVACAGFILAVAAASTPLFLSSAGSAALASNYAGRCPYEAGVRLYQYGPPGQVDDVGVRERVAPLGLAIPIRTVVGPASTLTNGAGDHFATVTPMTRDGFVDHIRPLSGDGNGVWLADRTATELAAKPGDEITVRVNELSTTVRVGGIYTSLGDLPKASYWCSQDARIFRAGAFTEYVPPPLLLTDHATFLTMAAQLEHNDDEISWEQALTRNVLTPVAITRLNDQLGVIARSGPRLGTAVGDLLHDERATITGLKGAIGTVSLAGRLVALVLFAAAGSFWVERRRSEVALLTSKGVGPVAVAFKALLEMVLPAAAFAAIGWWAATRLVGWVGPTSHIDHAAVRDAGTQVVLSLVVALILLTVVAGATTRRMGEVSVSRFGRAATRAPWEIAILALAIASYYEVVTRGGSTVDNGTGTVKIDQLLLLFPMLFLAGGAGLIVRGIRRLLPSVRAAGGRLSPPLYLATRRLAGASRLALALVTAAALSIGILSYAGILAATSHSALQAKARVFTGSDVAVDLQHDAPVPPALRSTATKVVRADKAYVTEGNESTDVLAIDRTTFSKGAFWDNSFSDTSLSTLLKRLAPDPSTDAVSVLVVNGTLPTGTHLIVRHNGDDVDVPVEVVGELHAFPGLKGKQRLVVVGQDSFTGREPDGITQVWSKGQLSDVTGALGTAAVEFTNPLTARQALAAPGFRSVSWAFGFLQALGVLTALITVGGVLLYLAARQRSRDIAVAVTRRMGLTRRSHRLSVLAELGTMLVLGLVIGSALAYVAARLVYGRLDALPAVPPAPVLRVPLLLAGWVALAAVAVAWLGAAGVQWAADRADVSDVMRNVE
jgi:putative ABC transport system permease protein